MGSTFEEVEKNVEVSFKKTMKIELDCLYILYLVHPLLVSFFACVCVGGLNQLGFN